MSLFQSFPRQQSSPESTALLAAFTSPTAETVSGRRSNKTLIGFYAYSISSEVFAVVSLGLFLPIVLEQFARDNGVLEPDLIKSCPKHRTSNGPDEEQRCVVQLFGMWLNTTSFSLFTYSASVALQAVFVISMGALADNPRIRYRLLSAFGSIGSILTMSFLALSSHSPFWPCASLLAIGANVSFGSSVVCLNSYLPELGRHNPKVEAKYALVTDAQEQLRHLQSEDHLADHDPSDIHGIENDIQEAKSVLRKATEAYIAQKAMATSQISSRGIALGYTAGILLLILLLIPVSILKGSTFSMRLAIAVSGLWWGLGTLSAALWLKPEESRVDDIDPNKSYFQYAKEGWRGLGEMLQQWHRLPVTFIFLGAWFLLSDGFSTITSTATLFAKTTLGLKTTSLIILSVITPGCGIFGAVAFPRIQKKTLGSSWDNIAVLRLIVIIACFLPLWGIVALNTEWEILLLGALFGALLGSMQSYARTCFAELVPASQSARWFGLYSITDKSSSFIGPLFIALITNHTGQIRKGFWLILGMLLLTVPILKCVNMEQGRIGVDQYEREQKSVVEHQVVV